MWLYKTQNSFIQTSALIVSFETLAFRFKILNTQMNQKHIDRKITFLLEESVLHERK